MGTARPGANSDLFSLAVLSFMHAHPPRPLRGQWNWRSAASMSPPGASSMARIRYSFLTPTTNAIAPIPNAHGAALVTWPIYPDPLQALFVQTFGARMHNPGAGPHRPVAGSPGPALDQRQICPACGSGDFQATAPNPPAGAAMQPLTATSGSAPPRARVLAGAGNALHHHHFHAGMHRGSINPWPVWSATRATPACWACATSAASAWQASTGPAAVGAAGQTCNLAALCSSTHHGVIRIWSPPTSSPS